MTPDERVRFLCLVQRVGEEFLRQNPRVSEGKSSTMLTSRGDAILFLDGYSRVEVEKAVERFR